MNKTIKHKIAFAIGVIGFAIAVTACKTAKQNTERQLVGAAPILTFAFDKKGRCYAKNMQKLSEKDFFQLTSQGGLICLSTRIINEDGTLQPRDYHEMMIGISPINYYFKDGKCHSFFFSSAQGRNVTFEYEYKYDVKKNTLMIGNDVELQIIECSDEQLGAIIPMGVASDGRKQYAYVVYRRATGAEILHRLINTGLAQPGKGTRVIIE